MFLSLPLHKQPYTKQIKDHSLLVIKGFYGLLSWGRVCLEGAKDINPIPTVGDTEVTYILFSKDYKVWPSMRHFSSFCRERLHLYSPVELFNFLVLQNVLRFFTCVVKKINHVNLINIYSRLFVKFVKFMKWAQINVIFVNIICSHQQL